MQFPEGRAIVYCQGAFNTPNGKTAHGLVRFTRRYIVTAVVDSRYAGKDAGEVLDNKANGIKLYVSVDEAVSAVAATGASATHFVVGLAPDGGRLSPRAREDVKRAITLGLNVDCGLHDYLSEDPEMAALAQQYGITIRDVRKPPTLAQLHFFTGRIEQVKAIKIAVLGTDSAVGKRTTATLLVQGLRDAGLKAEMIGTGQTAWMQGVKYGFILDTLINDFLSGEIEYAIWRAWEEERPDVIVLEGQGSLMNPAYPGGYELLAAGRPDLVILQHAPARKEYDGFPGYRIQPLAKQIEAIQVVSGKPVAAITINHENLAFDEIPYVCEAIYNVAGLPAFDVLRDGVTGLVKALLPYIPNNHS